MTQTLAWIVVSGLLMSLLALSGSLTLVLPQRWFDRVVRPLVALSAGSLLGGCAIRDAARGRDPARQ
jgi:zinc and cadmium transporter